MNRCFNVKNHIVTISGTNMNVRNRLATELVMLKVHNVKLSFDIWSGRTNGLEGSKRV